MEAEEEGEEGENLIHHNNGETNQYVWEATETHQSPYFPPSSSLMHRILEMTFFFRCSFSIPGSLLSWSANRGGGLSELQWAGVARDLNETLAKVQKKLITGLTLLFLLTILYSTSGQMSWAFNILVVIFFMVISREFVTEARKEGGKWLESQIAQINQMPSLNGLRLELSEFGFLRGCIKIKVSFPEHVDDAGDELPEFGSYESSLPPSYTAQEEDGLPSYQP